MAISRAVARLLVAESGRLGLQGRVLQLGPQALYLRAGELRAYAAESGVRLGPGLLTAPDGAAVSAEQLYAAMGLDEVESCDLFDPTATYRVDLNEPVPDVLRGRYDLVVDGGTMEHVFDTRAVLANMADLLAPGGRVLHLAPTNNYVDHGFYMFSPTFFTSHYSTNRWDVESAWLLEHSRRWQRGRWRATAYRQGSLDTRSIGGWEKGSCSSSPSPASGRTARPGRSPNRARSGHRPASMPAAGPVPSSGASGPGSSCGSRRSCPPTSSACGPGGPAALRVASDRRTERGR